MGVNNLTRTMFLMATNLCFFFVAFFFLPLSFWFQNLLIDLRFGFLYEGENDFDMGFSTLKINVLVPFPL